MSKPALMQELFEQGQLQARKDIVVWNIPTYIPWRVPNVKRLESVADIDRAFDRLPTYIRGLRDLQPYPVWDYSGFEVTCGPREGFIQVGTNPIPGLPLCIGFGSFDFQIDWFGNFQGIVDYGWHPAFGPTAYGQIKGWKRVVPDAQPLKYVRLEELPHLVRNYWRLPDRIPFVELNPSYWTTFGYDAVAATTTAPSFIVEGTGKVEETLTPDVPLKPPRGEAEKKFKLRSSGSAIVRGFGHITEILDFVEAIWDSIPKKDPVTGKSNHKSSALNWVKIDGKWQQVRVRSDRGVPKTHPAIEKMLRDIANNLTKIDAKQAMKNVLWNEVQDRLIGKANQKANEPFLKAQAKYGSKRPVGTGFGPLM